MVGVEKSRSFRVKGKIDGEIKEAYQFREIGTNMITEYEVEGSPLSCNGFESLYNVIVTEEIAYDSDMPVIQIDEIVSTKAQSSYCPRFDMIPYSAMTSLAKRYELGAKKYAKDNWRKGLTDRDYVIERINHGINHALTLIQKLEGRIPFDKDDDAGGMLWAGAFAAEAIRVLHPEVVEDFE